MVHIVPSLSFLKVLKEQIESGQSTFHGIQRAAKQEQTQISSEIFIWANQYRNESLYGDWNPKSHYQLSLKQILKNGMNGAPVYESIVELEAEMEFEFEIQWKRHLETLPAKLSIPLLLFFFPAYVFMLFGPLLSKIIMEVQ